MGEDTSASRAVRTVEHMDIARDVNRRAVRQAVSALAGLAVALTVVKVSVERRKRANR